MLVGEDRQRQILVWFAVAMALSTVLPNTVVAAAMMPIVIAMLRFIGLEDLAASRFATAVAIAVAWGTSVGGAGHALGGAPNLLTVGFIEDLVTGQEFLFTTWVTRLLPINLVLMAAALLYMRFAFPVEGGGASAGREYFRGELRQLGTMTVPERWALGLFAGAALLAFARPLYAAALPELHPGLRLPGLRGGGLSGAAPRRAAPRVGVRPGQDDLGALLPLRRRRRPGASAEPDGGGPVDGREPGAVRRRRRPAVGDRALRAPSPW